MSEQLRCFVSVEIPQEIRGEIGAFLGREGPKPRGVRWVAAEQLHLTLKFLGAVDDGRVSEIAAALDAGAARIPQFSVQLQGTGVFPSPRRPRVVWIGIAAGAQELSALAAQVESALGPLGFPPEERPFAPHLTLGRFKEPPRDPDPLRRLLEGTRERLWGSSFRAAGVQLMRSRLFPTGAVYSILHESPLSAEAGAGRGPE